MATRFRRTRGGVTVTFHPDEAVVLVNLLEQLTELLDDSDESGNAGAAGGGGEEPAPDPLAEMVGIGSARALPQDPALARLFPDAYPDDPEKAGEFRRFTEQGLRDRKQEAVGLTRATLEDPGTRRTLSAAEAQAWLTVLTDLRIVLGTRLEVTEDWAEQLAELPDDDPRRASFAAYDWLSYLQESLVHALW